MVRIHGASLAGPPSHRGALQALLRGTEGATPTGHKGKPCDLVPQAWPRTAAALALRWKGRVRVERDRAATAAGDLGTLS